MQHERHDRHSPSTWSGSNMEHTETDPKEKGDSTITLPTAPRHWHRVFRGSHQGGNNDARARQELPNQAGLWALAGAPTPYLPCPSASTAQTQQGPGDDSAGTLAQPHRCAHVLDALALSHQRACCATRPRQTPTSVGTRKSSSSSVSTPIAR